MTTRPFGYHVEDGVATITLDRPDRLNALTFEVYRKLTDELYRLRFDDEVRVVLLTGAGKGFCSAATSTTSSARSSSRTAVTCCGSRA